MSVSDISWRASMMKATQRIWAFGRIPSIRVKAQSSAKAQLSEQPGAKQSTWVHST